MLRQTITRYRSDDNAFIQQFVINLCCIGLHIHRDEIALGRDEFQPHLVETGNQLLHPGLVLLARFLQVSFVTQGSHSSRLSQAIGIKWLTDAIQQIGNFRV